MVGVGLAYTMAGAMPEMEVANMGMIGIMVVQMVRARVLEKRFLSLTPNNSSLAGWGGGVCSAAYVHGHLRRK